jgi:hypothetical protein
VAELFRQHLGLAVTSLLVLATALRLLVVGGFDPGTLAILLRTGGVFQVLTSVLVLIAVSAVLIGASVLLFRLIESATAPRLVAFLSLASVAFFVVPWPLLVIVPVYVLAALPLLRRYAQGAGKSRGRRGLGRWKRGAGPKNGPKLEQSSEERQAKARRSLQAKGAAGLAVLILVPLLQTEYAWLPTENLNLADGVATSGYVIPAEGDWLHLIDLRDRSVLTLRDREIEKRQVCIRPSWRDMPRLYSSVAALPQRRPEPDHPVCIS